MVYAESESSQHTKFNVVKISLVFALLLQIHSCKSYSSRPLESHRLITSIPPIGKSRDLGIFCNS